MPNHLVWLAVIQLIELHAPNGQPVFINIDEISSMRTPTDSEKAFFQDGSNCLLVTTNRKFMTVVETCVEIRNIIMDK